MGEDGARQAPTIQITVLHGMLLQALGESAEREACYPLRRERARESCIGERGREQERESERGREKATGTQKAYIGGTEHNWCSSRMAVSKDKVQEGSGGAQAGSSRGCLALLALHAAHVEHVVAADQQLAHHALALAVDHLLSIGELHARQRAKGQGREREGRDREAGRGRECVCERAKQQESCACNGRDERHTERKREGGGGPTWMFMYMSTDCRKPRYSMPHLSFTTTCLPVRYFM